MKPKDWEEIKKLSKESCKNIIDNYNEEITGEQEDEN